MTRTDGFVRLPNWLLDDSDLTLQELAVYIVLLRFRDPKTGRCFPGISTIADRARMSRDSVKRTIPKLEARGMITVERRSTVRENKPNVYQVAVATETPAFVWENSARGQRAPKRPLTDEARRKLSAAARKRQPSGSEHLGAEVAPTPSGSEHLPGGSEHLPPGAPSAPKKLQENKIHEQASTRTLVSVRVNDDRFTFDGEEDRATERQVAYLKDLATHLSYGSTGGTPDELQLQRWRKLTRAEADNQINGYKKALGRPDDIQYPEYGSPEYDQLSDAGKEFADTGGMPDSVFDYAFKLKENKPA